MPCAVIQVLHPMVGVDIHAELTPTVPPIPFPFVPHAVAAIMGNGPGLIMDTVKRTDTSKGKKAVLINFVRMPIIIQGSDIGPLIAHLPLVPCMMIPNLPLIILGSGSASEFFAFSVKAHGKAVANAPFTSVVAMNMNCGFPPTPGIVIAPSLVFTGFRIGDFIAGMVGLLMDAALSAAISIVFNGIPLGNKEGAKVLFGGGLMGLITGQLGGPVIKGLITGGIPLLIGSFGLLGSPLGYSNEQSTLLGGGFKKNKNDEHGRVGSGWGSFKENTQNAVAGYFTAP